MTRVKSPSARKHRKIKQAAAGFKHARRKRVKNAKEALLHAGQYAYVGRKLRKRDMKKLWIMRLNAAVREYNTTYSKFAKTLKDNKIEINRKLLAEIAVKDKKAFSEIMKKLGFKTS